MGAITYSSEDLLDMKKTINQSLEDIESTYKELRQLGSETGIGGTISQQLNKVLDEGNEYMNQLKNLVTEMNEGMDIKIREQDDMNNRISNLFRGE